MANAGRFPTWVAASVMALMLAGTALGDDGVAAELARFERSRPLMGTVFQIVLHAPDEKAADEAARAAFDRVAELNQIMSDYVDDSELMKLNRAGDSAVPISEDLWNVLSAARGISEKSDGAFDVTVAPLVRRWRQARQRKKLPEPAQLAEARLAVGYQKLLLLEDGKKARLSAAGMRIDLGGIAKGYACQQALATLKARGIARAMVIGGGDIALGAPPPGEASWRVAIVDPRPAGHRMPPMPSLRGANGAVSTSGDLEQFVEIEGVRYSHIVDARTGLGLINRIQATVWANDATSSDALATAACVLGVERGLRLIDEWPGAAALVVTPTAAGGYALHASKRWGERVDPVAR